MAGERETGAKNLTTRLLVVGGSSRSATAFRREASRQSNIKLTTLVRRSVTPIGAEDIVQVDDYFALPDEILRRADVVVNFVGLTKGHDEELLSRINVTGPLHLAELARSVGVAHFIQLSSFHVYGYAEAISAATPVAPRSAYARSKLAADVGLLNLATAAFMVTILRLPILYGRGVGENLTKLAELMMKVPMFPVSASTPRRSALHVDNLAVLLETVILQGLGGVRFGADADPFTLEMLADAVGKATGTRPHLAHLPAPVFLPLRVLARGFYYRLYRPNLVEPSCCVQPWRQYPVAVEAGLRDTVPT